jgi:syntaxin 1B/2/3
METEHTQKLDEAQDRTNKALGELKSRLKGVTAYLRRLPTAADANLARSRQAALARKVQDTAEHYQSIQVRYKQKYRDKLEREIRIARPDASRAELEAALDATTGSVFSQQLLSSRTAQQRGVLQEVQSRHEELRRLEESIEELFTLYQDMELLIATQQETFDVIEANVGTTETQLEAGSKEISKAITYRLSARRRAWWICGIITVVLIVALLLLFFFVIRPLVPPPVGTKAEDPKPAPPPAASPAS